MQAQAFEQLMFKYVARKENNVSSGNTQEQYKQPVDKTFLNYQRNIQKILIHNEIFYHFRDNIACNYLQPTRTESVFPFREFKHIGVNNHSYILRIKSVHNIQLNMYALGIRKYSNMICISNDDSRSIQINSHYDSRFIHFLILRFPLKNCSA